MDIGDMLYILQRFNLNFIPFFIVNILSCSTTIVQHLRLDYCEIFEYSVKGNIDKSKWNMSCIKKYNRVLSKRWQPSRSIESVRLRWHGLG